MITVLATHTADCMCPACIVADMDAQIAKLGLDPANYPVEPMPTAGKRTRYATPGTGGTAYRQPVRTVSKPQVAFMRRLLAERDTSKLIFLPGSERIDRMSLTGARDLIEKLLRCPLKPGASAERAATEKQYDWLVKLADREVPAGSDAAKTRQAAIDGQPVTFAAASVALDILFKAPRTAVAKEVLTVGVYRRANGTVVRVAKSRGHGHLYGKVWDAEAKTYAYRQGALTGLTPGMRLTLAEVEALGELWGSCMVCGADLTATVGDKAPKDRFIGPICESKY